MLDGARAVENAMPAYVTGRVRPKLREALLALTVDRLRPLMELLPFSPPLPTRKLEMVELIEGHLAGDRLMKAWGDLDPDQQMAVREAVHGDGWLNPSQFKAKYGVLPAGLGKLGYGESSLLRLFLYPYIRYGAPDHVPPDLATRLGAFVEPPPRVTVEAIDALPEAVTRGAHAPNGEDRRGDEAVLIRRDMERAASQDLKAVLRLIQGGAVAVSAKTRRATAAAVRRIAGVLSDGDFFDPLEQKKRSWDQVPGAVRAFAWPWLVQAAKLARLRGSRLELTKAGRAALAGPAAQTLRHAWECWVYSDLLDEFNRIDDIKGQFRGKGRRSMTAAPGRRRVIAGALAECPVGRWVRFDDFSRFMRAVPFHFEVTQDPWRLYITDQEYGSLGYDSYHGWRIVQGRYLLCVLFEYAATLGMVDVAYVHPKGARRDYIHMWGTDDLGYLSRYDGLMYFRLNALGAYCLGVADTYETGPGQANTSLSVFPDRRVRLNGALSAEERLLLETYAVAEMDGIWRLDSDRILSALENGAEEGELRRFLAERDDQPLPETVEGFLRGIERGASALKFGGTALLIECADAEIAARIVADSRLAKLCLPAGDRHLVVKTRSEKAFRKASHALGYGIRE